MSNKNEEVNKCSRQNLINRAPYVRLFFYFLYINIYSNHAINSFTNITSNFPCLSLFYIYPLKTPSALTYKNQRLKTNDVYKNKFKAKTAKVNSEEMIKTIKQVLYSMLLCRRRTLPTMYNGLSKHYQQNDDFSYV